MHRTGTTGFMRMAGSPVVPEREVQDQQPFLAIPEGGGDYLYGQVDEGEGVCETHPDRGASIAARHVLSEGWIFGRISSRNHGISPPFRETGSIARFRGDFYRF